MKFRAIILTSCAVVSSPVRQFSVWFWSSGQSHRAECAARLGQAADPTNPFAAQHYCRQQCGAQLAALQHRRRRDDHFSTAVGAVHRVEPHQRSESVADFWQPSGQRRRRAAEFIRYFISGRIPLSAPPGWLFPPRNMSRRKTAAAAGSSTARRRWPASSTTAESASARTAPRF